jgi:hypothetical protein
MIGFAAFTGVKLIGYTGAAMFLQRKYEEVAQLAVPENLGKPRPNPFVFGGLRTGLGIFAGALWSLVWATIAPSAVGVAGFYLSLIPVRMLEWSLMIWIFHERKYRNRLRLTSYSARGIVWSYVLDAPAVAGVFVIPGGMWIC